MNNATVLRWED